MPKRKPLVFNEVTNALNTLGVSVVDAIRVRDKAERNKTKEVFSVRCGKIMDGTIYVLLEFDFKNDKPKEVDNG